MIGGAKFFADGALGSMTAWMLEPYANTENYGVPGPRRRRFSGALAARFKTLA